MLIKNTQLYEQAKLLDHSAWKGLLPRGGIPSDNDMLFDNNGDFLMCEMKSYPFNWGDLSAGQKKLLFNLMTLNEQRVKVVLIQHKIPQDGKYIDTVNDVVAFQIVVLRDGELTFSKKAEGRLWPLFVKKWFGA